MGRGRRAVQEEGAGISLTGTVARQSFPGHLAPGAVPVQGLLGLMRPQAQQLPWQWVREGSGGPSQSGFLFVGGAGIVVSGVRRQMISEKGLRLQTQPLSTPHTHTLAPVTRSVWPPLAGGSWEEQLGGAAPLSVASLPIPEALASCLAPGSHQCGEPRCPVSCPALPLTS